MIEQEPKISSLPDISLFYKSAVEAVENAISMLEDMLSSPRYKIIGRSLAYNILRRDLPYVIHKTAILETFILLNRNYKPVGSSQEYGVPWTIYEDFINLHVHLTPAQMTEVVNLVGNSCNLFGEPPWNGRDAAKGYLERLKSLYRTLMDCSRVAQ